MRIKFSAALCLYVSIKFFASPRLRVSISLMR